MINVKYIKPTKLACPQEILVSFRYKQSIVDAIRLMPDRYYDAKNREWHLSYDCLSALQKALPDEEFNIEGKPIDNKRYGEKIIEKHYELPKELKTKLYSYQEEGFNEMMNFDKFLLLWEMGLGKTACAITVALKRKELNGIKHCLVVCGVNSIKFNWQEEIKIHTGMDSIILGARKNKKGVIEVKSNKDKLEDLDNLNEFFIITNIETFRDKKIKDKLKKLVDRKIIEMIVFDECHKCFDYDTKIITNHGYIKIGDIVENDMQDVFVASYNTETNKIEYKPVLNKFRNKTAERRVKVTIKMNRGNKYREIICTESHLFYTKNRGWVQAKDLTSEDDLVNYTEELKCCYYCGKEIHVSNDRAKNGVMFCSRQCSAFWRNKHYGANLIKEEVRIENAKRLREMWKDDSFRKSVSKRMRENNPSKNPEVKKKIVNSIRNGVGYKNQFKYGNGKISLYESKAMDILSPFGFVYNFAINTERARKAFPDKRYAYSYKPDFLNMDLKLCIEIDGNNHKNDSIKLLDRKKEECLNYLGYKVIRYTHEDVDNGKLLEDVHNGWKGY